MALRRLLTPEYLDSLKPPIKGEVWIADTAIRGFGVRMWTSENSSGSAFTIRTPNKVGRSIRKTFNPIKQASWQYYAMLRRGEIEFDENLGIKLSVFLEDAKEWAKDEIDRLKGRRPTHEEEADAEAEYKQMLKALGVKLQNHSLGHLVELVLSDGMCRGWNENYSDRLRVAFNAFDSGGQISKLTVSELSDGRLNELMRASDISSGNFRLLRSLFKVVFWNIHTLGGGPIGNLLPGHRRLIRKRNTDTNFYTQMQLEDYQKLFIKVQEIPFDWRSRIAIELCFHLRAPVTKVLNGRWSQLHEGVWFHYHPNERKNWQYKYSVIDTTEFDCLKRIRNHALADGIKSDFWFPSVANPNQSISNIDRAWRAVLQELNWPVITLSQCCFKLKRRFFEYDLFDSERPTRLEQIKAQMKGWE